MAIRVTEEEKKNKCALRFYDMFDGWFDIYEGPFEKCLKKYNILTNNGEGFTSFRDKNYFAIYPADTQMLITPERLGR
jgi:hypothetical protein